MLNGDASKVAALAPTPRPALKASLITWRNAGVAAREEAWPASNGYAGRWQSLRGDPGAHARSWLAAGGRVD